MSDDREMTAKELRNQIRVLTAERDAFIADIASLQRVSEQQTLWLHKAAERERRFEGDFDRLRAELAELQFNHDRYRELHREWVQVNDGQLTELREAAEAVCASAALVANECAEVPNDHRRPAEAQVMDDDFGSRPLNVTALIAERDALKAQLAALNLGFEDANKCLLEAEQDETLLRTQLTELREAAERAVRRMRPYDVAGAADLEAVLAKVTQ